MQQYNVIAMTTVGQRHQQEQLRKTTIQTTIQHVAHLLVVHATATCVHLNSGSATFLIPRTTWKTKQGPMDHQEPNSNNDHNQIIIKISFCISRD